MSREPGLQTFPLAPLSAQRLGKGELVLISDGTAEKQIPVLTELEHLRTRLMSRLRASSPGGMRVGEGRGKGKCQEVVNFHSVSYFQYDLIGQIVTAKHPFWGRNSSLWDASAGSPYPLPFPHPLPLGELARRLACHVNVTYTFSTERWIEKSLEKLPNISSLKCEQERGCRPHTLI